MTFQWDKASCVQDKAAYTRLERCDSFEGRRENRINGILCERITQTVSTCFFSNESSLAACLFASGACIENYCGRFELYQQQNMDVDVGTPLCPRRARVASKLVNAGDAHAKKKHHNKGRWSSSAVERTTKDVSFCVLLR